MTLKKVAGISIAALMAGMMITTAHAEDGKYVQNSDGQAVKNSVEGTCVNSQFGSMPEGCEAAPPPAPPPAPVPPPAPAPAPIKHKVTLDYSLILAQLYLIFFIMTVSTGRMGFDRKIRIEF